MRFLIYFVALAALIYLGVLIVQVFLKRLTSKDITRKKLYEQVLTERDLANNQLGAIKTYCDSVVALNDSDLTALNVLNIIHKESK